MADGIIIPTTGSGTATPTVATDDVSSVHYQRVKLDGGGDGLAVPIVAGQQLAAGSLPVVLTAAQITTLTPPAAITGFSTAANQATEIASLASLDGKAPALGQALAAASVPVVLTAAQITTLTPVAAITNYALETGGNLATAVASLSVLDDWDESDRAKVNPIVGQAGIAAGTGVDGATVPRVSLATNVPLPAGTNAIGKLAANSGVDIGDVDVTSVSGNVTVVQPTGTNLHVVVDSGSTSAVTQAIAANLNAQVAQVAGIMGSATLQSAATANGDGTSLTVTGYSTVVLTVNMAGAAGGTTLNFEVSEDGANWVATKGVLVANSEGRFANTTTAGVAVWVFPVAGMQLLRARISAYSAGTITVTGHASVQPYPFTLQALTAGSATIGALTANQSVNVAQIAAGTAITGGVTGSLAVGGPTASDGAIAANPVTIGGRAATAPPTAVSANADVVNVQTNLYGELIVRHALRETKLVQQTSISNSTSETTIVTADGTYKLDLYGLMLANAGTSSTKVTIKDSTAGTTRAVIYVPAGDTRGFMLPASDGIKQAAANNNWTATCATATTTLEVTALTVQNL